MSKRTRKSRAPAARRTADTKPAAPGPVSQEMGATAADRHAQIERDIKAGRS